MSPRFVALCAAFLLSLPLVTGACVGPVDAELENPGQGEVPAEPAPAPTPFVSTLELTNHAGSDIETRIYAYGSSGGVWRPEGWVMLGYFSDIQNAVIEPGRRIAAGETVRYQLPVEAAYYVLSKEAGTGRPLPMEQIDLEKEAFPGRTIPSVIPMDVVRGHLVTVRFEGYSVWAYNERGEWKERIETTPPEGAYGGVVAHNGTHFLPKLSFKNDGSQDSFFDAWESHRSIDCQVDGSAHWPGDEGKCVSAFRPGTQMELVISPTVDAPWGSPASWETSWYSDAQVSTPCSERLKGWASNYCTFTLQSDTEVPVRLYRFLTRKPDPAR